MAEPGTVLSVPRAFLGVPERSARLLNPKIADHECAGALESCTDPTRFHRLLHRLSLHAYCPATHRDVVLAPLQANVDCVVRLGRSAYGLHHAVGMALPLRY